MRSKAVLAAALLTTALVCGGLFVERGLIGAAPASSRAGARLFDQVFDHVSKEYVDTLSDSALYARAASGVVRELHDPYSVYLTGERLARLNESTSGRYAGVGIQMDIRDGLITVVAPLAGGPAIAAGIQTGDRIVAVNGKDTHGLTSEEAQKTLRGPPGTPVRLTIERPGVEAHITFDVVRREIRVRSVPHALVLGNGAGYANLSVFSERSAAELASAIDSLRAAGVRSLILDLRGDPGGLLDQGVAVADLFLESGQKIVATRGRTIEMNRDFADRGSQRWPNLTLTVLVDSNTASASEIVAGALQDHDRAAIVGTTSYGKGSAQSVFRLPRGAALKLTTGLWYTPSGRSINRSHTEDSRAGDTLPKKGQPVKRYTTDSGRVVLGGGGITPDVVVPQPVTPEAQKKLEQALGTHIPQFRDALTDYALALKGSRAITTPTFVVTPEMRAELLRRMRSRKISVDSATYIAASPFIGRALGYEVARYVFGEQAEFERRLRDDPVVARALQLMAGAGMQSDVLKRVAK